MEDDGQENFEYSGLLDDARDPGIGNQDDEDVAEEEEEVEDDQAEHLQELEEVSMSLFKT